MATGSPIKELCDEITCPICLDYFKDPMTITECGHSFCHGCLTQWWGVSGTEACCPQCQERTQERKFKPNRQLANFVEIARNFQSSSSLQGKKEAEGNERVCEKHQERLKLFCKDHGTLICVVCDRSREHENHKVIPREEASQEYKDQIHSCLTFLKKEREALFSYKADVTEDSQELFNQTEAERQKTVAEFKQLHQFLEEQEKLLLTQMEEVEKEISRRRDEHLSRLSEELSSLEKMIQEMEEKCLQPASELLQDIENTLQRCQTKEAFKNPVVFSPALKWKIWEFCDINPFLEGVMKPFQDTLLSGLQLQKANVTLDPDTAHPRLILSEDHKSVKWGDKRQDLPNNPERFNMSPCVLGCKEFTAGRHCWEVSVGSEEEWAVGVARKSVRRKYKFENGPEEGIWAVEKWEGQYRPFSLPNPTLPPLSLSGKPKRIRLTLNYEGRQVAFFDADSTALIYMYSAASFSGEKLCPFFSVYYKSHLTLSS
ncbi:zinc finger protein RFP-like isoform X2 [Hemicordylus capensis]|uniref:zinc finger protein RFP-like isoform X2 n=1 Tax=Hemicordylus capensis TaxID=884348 RepID=UPI0023023601|nr:zinc finger protein RFP-like isoform X2 [Hemicordylus capensis]